MVKLSPVQSLPDEVAIAKRLLMFALMQPLLIEEYGSLCNRREPMGLELLDTIY
jgi:hypothetical protein